MKVSVIVLTYNQEQSIARTLESILSQQVTFDYEILIGDDCSTDQTSTICEAYAKRESKIRYIRHPKNLGVADNYFELLLQAQGEYIADCAGDDYWILPNKLQHQVEILDTHPSVSLVHTNWREEQSANGHLRPSARRSSEGCDEITFGRQLIPSVVFQTDQVVIHLCTALYRREPFLEFYHRYPTLFRGKDQPCEDQQVIFANCWLGEIFFWDVDSLSYTVSPGTLSNPRSYERRYLFSRQLTLLTHQFLLFFPIELDQMQSYYSYRFYEQLMHLFRLEATDRLPEVSRLMQEVGYQPTHSIQLLQGILRTPWLYRPLKQLRDQLVALKQKIR